MVVKLTKEQDIDFYRTELRVMKLTVDEDTFFDNIAKNISDLNDAKEKAERQVSRLEHTIREMEE